MAPGRNDNVESTSDERVVNNPDNTMRHNYRVLDENEKSDMAAVKDLGRGFVLRLHAIGGTPAGEGSRQASRELSIAQTKIEEAVMWAVKHITR